MKFNPQKDYYAVLGVTQNANGAAIQHAYRKLVAKYHPDRHHGHDLEELAREKLAELNEAYEVLSKPALKSEYDSARMSQRRAADPPYSGGNYCAPANPPNVSGKSLQKLVALVLFIAALPFILRVVRTPRAAALIGIAILLVWFGPKLLKRFKK
ncbi:MAG: J domain-containing protein [Deltaproteobacteria bacterium]|nr:J domain-containing protein [Deltaproteobacteria bacterium]